MSNPWVLFGGNAESDAVSKTQRRDVKSVHYSLCINVNNKV